MTVQSPPRCVPHNRVPLRCAGTSLFFDGQFAEACKAYNAGLRLEPTNAQFVEGLAQAEAALATATTAGAAAAGAGAGSSGDAAAAAPGACLHLCVCLSQWQLLL